MVVQGWNERTMNLLKLSGSKHIVHNFTCESELLDHINSVHESAAALAVQSGAAPLAPVRELYQQAYVAKGIIQPYSDDGWSLTYNWLKGKLCLLSFRLNK